MHRLYPVLKWLWYELRVGIPVALGWAVVLSIMLRQPFRITLIYSLCIGLTIQALIEAGRHGFTWLLRKRIPGCSPMQHNWPGWGLMAPWILVAGGVGYFAGHAMGDFFIGAHQVSVVAHNPRALFLMMVIVFAVSMACVYFFYSRNRMAVLDMRTQAALRSATENQLKMLESQLEPHMLFNTLANLRVLIGTDPPRAQAMLDRIISFLRATLEASRSDAHPLSAEFARLEDYLDMMQVRMGPRLHFRLDLPGELAALAVPPLLLQPLVENAIKHGLERKVAGGRVEVSARRQEDALILTVRDTGVGLGVIPGNGTKFGMRQVRERLHALHGNSAALDIQPADDDEGGTLVIVHLPLPSPP